MRIDFTVSHCANRDADFLMNTERTVIRQNVVLKKSPPVFQGPAANVLFMPQQIEACSSIHYLLRQQHTVDHVDHTVVADNVRRHDSRSIDKDFTVGEFNFD